MQNDVAVVSVKKGDYRIFFFWYMSKENGINIMKNFNLNKKEDYYKKFYCMNIRKKWVPIIKEIEKSY